jgi:hypothetical protein
MRALAIALIAELAMGLLPCKASENIVLESPTRLVVHGISEQALQAADSDSLSLFADGSTTTPVLGRGHVEGQFFVFEPRYPLRPGIAYRAQFQPAHLQAVLRLPPARSTQSTTVVSIFPSSDVVPENLLKFYIHFSAPMGRGNSYRHIALIDESNQPVNLPFIELAQELWDEKQQRLTVLLDPGRIKRGLKPNQDVGPPLVVGESYTLSIDKDWEDANRQPLDNVVRKEFRVTSFDDTLPDPSSWRITAPKLDSRDPLIVSFAEPLDSALLEHCLTVLHPRGSEMEGGIALANRETQWRFVPRDSWQPGQYILRIDSKLEDLAGNSIQRPFEAIGGKPSTKVPPFVERSFEIE